MQEEKTSHRANKKNWKYIVLLAIGAFLTIIVTCIRVWFLSRHNIGVLIVLVLIHLITYFFFFGILSIIALIVSAVKGNVKKNWFPVFAWLFLIASFLNIVIPPIKKFVPNPKIDNDKPSYPMSFSSLPSEQDASGPNPPDGAIHEDIWVNLSWTHRESAASFDVYFSDNFDDVNTGAEAAFQGNQQTTFFVVGFPGFPYPDGLVPEKTYYWRIDEVNDAEPKSPWKGEVWSFTVPKMPDDFPSFKSKDTTKKADNSSP
jgi:hypothetical protein